MYGFYGLAELSGKKKKSPATATAAAVSAALAKRESKGLPVWAWVGIVAGSLAVIGGGIYLLKRMKAGRR